MDIVLHTPYLNLGKAGRPDIFLKMECDQYGGSFKTRGIVNFLSHTPNVKGVVTYTTGNHGIALSAIAKKAGLPAIVISSAKLSEFKRSVIEANGATIEILYFYDVDMATAHALKVAEQTGFTFVPLFGNEYIVNGYGGIATEICNDFEGDISLYFPVGSGTLLLANGKRARELRHGVRVVGAEPMLYRRTDGSNQLNIRSNSIADSLSIDRIPLCNQPLTDYVDELVAIDEHSIAAATKCIYAEFGRVIEPSGAVSLAAALLTVPGEVPKVAVVTGQNVSLEQFNRIAGMVASV